MIFHACVGQRYWNQKHGIEFAAFVYWFTKVHGYPQFMAERYCFHQFFLNCSSCFPDRHLHSHCWLCPKFLSPHAFGVFLTMFRCASPYIFYMSGCTKQAQSFVFNIQRCILITIMNCSTVRTCPSADLQILYFWIDASAAAACLG